MNEEFVGNISTIVKVLVLTFVPAALLEQVDANALSVVLTGIIMFIFSIIDAKYPNTFKFLSKGNAKPTEEDIEEEINEEGI